MFLNTREGQEEPPMEPGARWNIDPWVALPPLNPQRFTTPANPRPFVCPVTSTYSPSRKMSTRISWPTSREESDSTRSSRSAPNAPFPAFWKWPSIGLLKPCAFFAPNPSANPSSPSLCPFFLWTMVQGPASITVTGTTLPWASKIWGIPNFFPMIPVVMICTLLPHPANPRSFSSAEVCPPFHPGRKVEFHERIDRRGGRLVDVQHALVRPDLELLPALLVDVWRAVHGEPFDLRGEGNRPRHLRPGLLRLFDDLAGRLVQELVIERFQADTDLLVFHRQGTSPFLSFPLFHDVRDDAGAHGAAALPDREPKLLLHRHRHDQLHRQRHA